MSDTSFINGVLDAIFLEGAFKAHGSYGIEPFWTNKGVLRHHIFHGAATSFLCGLNAPGFGDRPKPGASQPVEDVYRRYEHMAASVNAKTCFGCMRSLDRQRGAIERLGSIAAGDE